MISENFLCCELSEPFLLLFWYIIWPQFLLYVRSFRFSLFFCGKFSGEKQWTADTILFNKNQIKRHVSSASASLSSSPISSGPKKLVRRRLVDDFPTLEEAHFSLIRKSADKAVVAIATVEKKSKSLDDNIEAKERSN